MDMSINIKASTESVISIIPAALLFGMISGGFTLVFSWVVGIFDPYFLILYGLSMDFSGAIMIVLPLWYYGRNLKKELWNIPALQRFFGIIGTIMLVSGFVVQFYGNYLQYLSTLEAF